MEVIVGVVVMVSVRVGVLVAVGVCDLISPVGVEIGVTVLEGIEEGVVVAVGKEAGFFDGVLVGVAWGIDVYG